MSGSAPVPNYGGSATVPDDIVPAPVPNEEEEISDPKKMMAFDKKGYSVHVANHKRLSNWLGDLARDRIPITVQDWRQFPKEHKKLADDLWKHIRVKNFKTNELLFKMDVSK